MKTALRTRIGVAAFAVLAAITTPHAAAIETPGVRDGEIPVIRVIVDHEAQLALIPQGTVLPADFQIISSREESADGESFTPRSEHVARPLVFAYAPAKRFEKLTVKETPPGAHVEVVEINEPSSPERAAMRTGNPCPAVIVVQVAPEISHQVTCAYYTYPTGERTQTYRSFTSYPSTAFSSKIILANEDSNGIRYGAIVYSCPVSAGECTTPLWAYQPRYNQGLSHVSTASVRLPGVCTQDPPYCPLFTNTIVIPTVEP